MESKGILNTTGPSETEKLRQILLLFLRRCSDTVSVTAELKDQRLEELCHREAFRRGYPMKGRHSFRPFISGGIPMAINGYPHLKDTKVPVLIALYTAFLIYLDDVLCNDLVAVSEFNERLATGKVQRHFMLDHFAALIGEFVQHFPRIVYNMMLSSTMNFVTALLLEKEMQGMTIRSGAMAYPTLARGLSGASEVFALAIFPSSVPVATSIQALPELLIFINNGNDIMSFYKEECAGEDVNRVSMLSQCTGRAKVEVLKQLVDEAVTAHERIQTILADSESALEAYMHFSQGYLTFYFALQRYRLEELYLEL